MKISTINSIKLNKQPKLKNQKTLKNDFSINQN